MSNSLKPAPSYSLKPGGWAQAVSIASKLMRAAQDHEKQLQAQAQSDHKGV